MNSVNYTAEELEYVSTYERGVPDPDVWSADGTKAIKKTIKDHYIAQQNYRCAYCDHQIVSQNNASWDCDHIIPKDIAPEFLFVPQNLAIACKDCNLAKNNQEVRTQPVGARFPVQSRRYSIVHPHFDAYSDHLIWLGEVVIARTKDKGVATIAMCKLARYAALSIGASDNIMDGGIRALTAMLLSAKPGDDVRPICAAITGYIQAKQAPADE